MLDDVFQYLHLSDSVVPSGLGSRLAVCKTPAGAVTHTGSGEVVLGMEVERLRSECFLTQIG